MRQCLCIAYLKIVYCQLNFIPKKLNRKLGRSPNGGRAIGRIKFLLIEFFLREVFYQNRSELITFKF